MAAGAREAAPGGPTTLPDQSMNAADTLLRPALDAGFGDRPAILFEDRVVTYAELNADACRAPPKCAARGDPNDFAGNRVALGVVH